MKYTLLALFGLSACGFDNNKYECVDPDFHVAGLSVCAYGNDVSPAEIEDSVLVVENIAREIYGDKIDTPLADKLEKYNTTLELWPVVYASQCEDSNDYFCNTPDNVTYIQYKGRKLHSIEIIVRWGLAKCAGLTSLPHELFHTVDQFYLGGVKTDHSTPNMFSEYARTHGMDHTQTAEYLAETELVNSWCEF